MLWQLSPIRLITKCLRNKKPIYIETNVNTFIWETDRLTKCDSDSSISEKDKNCAPKIYIFIKNVVSIIETIISIRSDTLNYT